MRCNLLKTLAITAVLSFLGAPSATAAETPLEESLKPWLNKAVAKVTEEWIEKGAVSVMDSSSGDYSMSVEKTSEGYKVKTTGKIPENVRGQLAKGAELDQKALLGEGAASVSFTGLNLKRLQFVGFRPVMGDDGIVYSSKCETESSCTVKVPFDAAIRWRIDFGTEIVEGNAYEGRNGTINQWLRYNAKLIIKVTRSAEGKISGTTANFSDLFGSEESVKLLGSFYADWNRIQDMVAFGHFVDNGKTEEMRQDAKMVLDSYQVDDKAASRLSVEFFKKYQIPNRHMIIKTEVQNAFKNTLDLLMQYYLSVTVVESLNREIN